MLYSFNFSKLFQIHLKMQQMLFQRLKMFWGSIPRTPPEVFLPLRSPPPLVKYSERNIVHVTVHKLPFSSTEIALRLYSIFWSVWCTLVSYSESCVL